MSIEDDTSNLRAPEERNVYSMGVPRAAKQHSQKKNDGRAKSIRAPTKRNRISKKSTPLRTRHENRKN